MIEGQYNHKNVEDKIYKLWEESGFFDPDKLPNSKKRKPFTIIMPPTNANGNLHAGHALVMTIEDIMTRYKRMKGFKALWLPGLDHAGFETQVVYEKKLEKEGRSRFKMTKEELYKEIWDFTAENKTNIKNQVKKMGSSCDWSREKFTLDQDIVKIVYETFDQFKKDGLIYKGRRISNWCPKHQTSLSDLETKDEERIEKFYYLKYGPFTIATSRPETKFGDKYVVVHPDDKRYAEYKDGQKIQLEWINGPITATIIKDAKSIDLEFGTGAMTVTPWHDAVDFDLSQRRGIEQEQIIDLQGRLLPIAGEFAGMKILEARPKIIEKLQAKGLVVKIEENYKHVVKTCYKCNTLIEPQIMEQWFLKMEPLAKPAIKAIQTGKIKFIPEHYKKIALHWLNNILDWPLSRQIAWGIPIPGDENGDTFDTWFSSGQWPFATLMASHNKNDIKNFYPTDVMETGGDLIFFWVSRMIMFSLYRTGKIPFKNVYMHGLVLDAKGQKMSKSKGNVINPLDLIEKYGTDALRMNLVVGNTPGTSLPLDENKIKGYRNFANKIWNAGRFVLMNTDGVNLSKKPKLSKEDAKHLSELNKLISKITKQMDSYKFYLAGEEIYHYFWHVFCDKIIEEKKKDIMGENLAKKNSAKWLLLEIYATCMQLLHPFMPFITEEIWQELPIKKKNLLIVENWPK